MKRIISLLMLAVVVLMLVAQTPITAFAVGHNKQEAEGAKVTGEKNEGTISEPAVSDWYSFKTGDEPAYYLITLHNESARQGINMELYTERDEILLSIEHIAASEEQVGGVRLEPNATYYLRVFCYEGGGNYYFRINKQWDVGQTKETAEHYRVNQNMKSTIDGPYDLDYFVFTTGELHQEYKVVYNNISGTTNGHVWIYSDRDELLLEAGEYTGANQVWEGTITLEPNSTYYVVAMMNDNGAGEYSFTISQCVDRHTKGDAWITAWAPNCTYAGERIKICGVCGEVLEREITKPLGHVLGKWQETRKATWLSLGEKKAVCTLCGETEIAKDYSKVWILPVVVLGGIVLLIGLINYIRTFFKERY